MLRAERLAVAALTAGDADGLGAAKGFGSTM
jgi:hypothetical protein